MEENKRPWGEYEILLETPYTKVKEIKVNPKGRLSLQYHRHREERWIITQGEGVVTLNTSSNRYGVRPGHVIPIQKMQPHRIENTGDNILTFIEVQLGESFDENDIVRIEDEYGRVDAQ